MDDPRVSEYRTYDASAAMSAAVFAEWSLGRMNNAVSHCLFEALPRLELPFQSHHVQPDHEQRVLSHALRSTVDHLYPTY